MEKDENLIYCPRCDRGYTDWEILKKHVLDQHPDHDPEWYDTGEPVP